MNAKDIPNGKLSRNEYIQWGFILGGLLFVGLAIASNYYQIRLNKKLIKDLQDKERRDHPDQK